MVVLLNKYLLGDMECYYYLDEGTKLVELIVVPEGMEPLDWSEKKQEIDSLVQLKVAGDIYPGGYAGGVTLRQGGSLASLQYETQYVEKDGGQTSVYTVLSYKNRATCKVTHRLCYKEGSEHLESDVTLANEGDKEISLEMLSSFSLGGISPFIQKDAHDSLKVHRLRSVWSMEGRLETRTIEELQLEPSWAGHAIRSERFGQVGSIPVNRYFPYLVVEDSVSDVFWGVQLGHNASWQMEVYRKDDGVSISGGLADREFGHWMKCVQPGESFSVPTAILSICKGGGVDKVSQRMTAAIEEYVNQEPEIEQDLPIIFNEYCTTWGCPSDENIAGILEVIKDKGFSYFVIDCGWYKKEGIPWDIMMGDYNVSKELFPEGLEKTVQRIKEAGMKPGIWFEIENVGSASEIYNDEEHLLKRDGEVLTTSMRRFLDLRNPWVINYLNEKVIGTLKRYGFEYMKMDYNDTIGLGCDGAESLGEGLRQNMAASLEFIKRVKEEIPGIILENCASGGHRLEPLMMSLTSMASFSDAHECEEIPVIAANLHRAILPRQSQIWAVIRKEDSLKRIAYSVINTFLGRMCISGDVTELSVEQWDVIDRGMAFYKKIAPIIKHGYTYFYGSEITSYRNLKGWQGILRTSESGEAYALFHVFEVPEGSMLKMELPAEVQAVVQEVYSDSKYEVTIEGNLLCYKAEENKKAVAVLLGGK
ncbi:glycoside hydrolase family 36 protein [Kineothrix sp. MB12-C1]|uniref:glycoside hydrolase family 36 protein n=1 Tax=Kineothrix sp. MB12-C1 TaxID=3070215 RepID=UPI0027D32CBE|nr:glycoside hydrolase family 36 protein [Kineothrix sp. MB12-C1]WMC91466.1 alpha-galactosidase [Kineothrix sp. MB12-C1]